MPLPRAGVPQSPALARSYPAAGGAPPAAVNTTVWSDHQCAPGYRGPRCALCAADFYSAPLGTCEACGGCGEGASSVTPCDAGTYRQPAGGTTAAACEAACEASNLAGCCYYKSGDDLCELHHEEGDRSADSVSRYATTCTWSTKRSAKRPEKAIAARSHCGSWKRVAPQK